MQNNIVPFKHPLQDLYEWGEHAEILCAWAIDPYEHLIKLYLALQSVAIMIAELQVLKPGSNERDLYKQSIRIWAVYADKMTEDEPIDRQHDLLMDFTKEGVRAIDELLRKKIVVDWASELERNEFGREGN